MKKKLILIFSIILILFLIVGSILVFNGKKNDKEKEKEKVKILEKKENVDNVKPVITLKGASEVNVIENGEYVEKGYTATDNIDGDITKNVKIKGKVNINVPGEYILKYIVKDSSKNETIEERKVNVIKVDEKDTDGISVLMYHYFYDDEKGETAKNSNYTAKTSFEEQLKYLKDNNYYFPTMREINMYLDRKIELPKKSVVITMDDGESSNYTIAYPLALKYKIPMTMFVVTSWTNVNDSLQKSMTDSGYMVFQSHSHDMHKGGCPGQNHGALMQCIDYNEGVNDLKKSKELIGNADSFEYTCGDYNDTTIKMLAEAGYSLAFTTTYGRVTRGQVKLALPRIRINGGISLESFIKSL